MKSRYLLVLALLLLVISPVAAADMYSEENILIDTEYTDYFAKLTTVTHPGASGSSAYYMPNGIIMSSPLSVPEFNSMFTQMPASSLNNYGSIPNSGEAKVNWHKSNQHGVTGDFYMSGTYGYFKYTAGGDDYLQIWADFDDPVSELTGPTYLKCVLQDGESIVWPKAYLKEYYVAGGGNSAKAAYDALVTDTSGIKATFGNTLGTVYPAVYTLAGTNVKTYILMSTEWKNGLRVETIGGGVPRAQIDITKEYDGYLGISDHYVKFGETVYTVTGGESNVQYVIPESEYPISVSIRNPLNKWYNSTYGEAPTSPTPDDPTDPPALTVYIKNSQTGALIANSNIVIDALVNGEYYPVVNRTEPSGIFTINLQPTGGGPPNPDGYRLIVTADGYNNPMPEINFTVDDYKQSIYCLLDPIAGGPVDENNTFIDFFVSDMYANPVPGASVKFGKYTLITNSAGYTVFEVPKNDYYTYTVSKSGYNSLTGNANIGDAPRNTINTYLTPVTTPPTQPTDWPTTPTPPTGGIPDEDDDSDGFLMQSVRGIANLFGVSFGTGKTILGMLLALGIGTATAKQLKGGAQEFGMGMLGGVVLGVLIGLLPIWVLVLLVLIVGLWIGQRYMSGGDS
ncbi:MAG: hypothetical protein ACOYCB_14270 [Fastidiosipilaceae bacterium]|jgi:hypothetical protein